MKILRMCLQGGRGTVFDNKKELKNALIDLHCSDCETDKDRKIISKMSLNELCVNFGWDYKKINNKDAKWFD